MQEVDAEGMDKQDRRYLETLIQVFHGGPTGAEALSATMNLAVDTLTDEVEPYLLRRHFIVRTPRGRRATAAAYRHLGLPEPPPSPRSRCSIPSGGCSSRALASGEIEEACPCFVFDSSWSLPRHAQGIVARRRRSRIAAHSGRSGGRTRRSGRGHQRVELVKDRRRGIWRQTRALPGGSGRARRGLRRACAADD